MSVRWYTIVIDSQDVRALARWWAAALGWVIDYEADDEVTIAPPQRAHLEYWSGDAPIGWVFVPVPEGKTVKNRIHIDLAPEKDDDQEAEVARLVELGATRVDVGQTDDDNWVVLADPEGNEFCVLSPRDQ